MFYRGEFNGNHIDLMEGDFTQAETHGELASLIDKLVEKLTLFNEHNAPKVITDSILARLDDVIKYYKSVGGEI